MSEAILSRAIGDRLAYLRSAFGLASYPSTAMLYPSLYLTYAPEAIEPRPDGRMRGIRAPLQPRGGRPAALQALPPGSLVYVSLGTVFNRMDVFRTILDGLRDEPVSVLATVGHDLDPAAFGPQPTHVRIERFVPHDDVLPHASLFITHSSLHTALSALRHGAPLLMVPQGGDQPAHAVRLARHRVGLILRDPANTDPSLRAASKALSAEHVRETVRELRVDTRYAAAARAIAAEMAAMPEVRDAVGLLERLAATGSTVDA
jgi:MGT family glycosyltransferase